MKRKKERKKERKRERKKERKKRNVLEIKDHEIMKHVAKMRASIGH
jgi:hypothetical protein